ncbi:uncharacterized protein LOC143212707 [Lasioglossum baleicum]|uniref:uncharacterized protein LOC143212707 n=1 Tax=Lasioglossum baleicum TaxID=434251 RepID=UPI003FCC8064
MRLRILFIALISTTLAQQEQPRRPARTSQAQIKYNDPNGSKVDWKLFAPQNQWRAHLESSQRRQRGQTEYVHPQQSVQRAPHQSQLVQLQHDLDPSQYKVAYQQVQATQVDPSRYKGYSQNQLTQAGPAQYRGYSQAQAQPQAHQEQPVQVEYRPYPQPQAPVDAQPAPIQVQYKAYAQPQAPRHPVDAQPAPIQVHYKAYAPPQSRVDAQPDQIQYKTYQQAQTQTEAQSEQNQIQQKAYSQAQAPIEAPQGQQYRPLSEGPAYVKQLLLENFKPQRPYADPSAFIYTTNFPVPQQHDQQPANAELSHYEQTSESYEQPEQLKTRREYSDRGLQGRIVYKDDYKQQEQQQSPQVQYLQVPIEKIPTPSPPSLVFDKNMPPEIRQLLQFQAQLPYDVIANSITYKPKTLFIPKPLPPDASGSYHYRSKVYYMNDDRYEQEPEFETAKPVQEEQRH